MSTIIPIRSPNSRRVSELIDPRNALPANCNEYERLGDVLKNPRVELIDGILVGKMTKKPPHVVGCDLTRSAIDHLLPRGWHTRGRPGEDSSIQRARARRLGRAGSVARLCRSPPWPRDVALVVEVADTSLAKDRLRVRVYGGKAEVPVYWIVNLVDRQVEVYTGPRSNGYSSRVDYAVGEACQS